MSQPGGLLHTGAVVGAGRRLGVAVPTSTWIGVRVGVSTTACDSVASSVGSSVGGAGGLVEVGGGVCDGSGVSVGRKGVSDGRRARTWVGVGKT